MSSLRAKIVRATTGAYFSTIDANTADVREMRRKWHSFAGILKIAKGISVEAREYAGLHSEWLTPDEAFDGKLILYLHGGAYIMGNCATHRQMVSYIARAAGARAILPEYRLAPEHPFPAAIEDAVRTYHALLANGYSPDDVVIMGDSAGGGLTMATLLSLREAGSRLPAAACLLSPWLDLTASGESMSSRAHKDPWFKPGDLPIVSAYYCREDDLTHPLVSPVFADLAGLPPLYIQVGSDEILLSDSTRIADKVRDAGGDVEIETWPGMWHVFQVFVRRVPESRRAVCKIGDYVRRALKCAPAAP